MNPAHLSGSPYWLPLVGTAVVGLAVAMYVVLDGFDLGIGILFPFYPREADRDQMMNSVAPFWDGNETWLVLGGVWLLVAFPLAYSILTPALYVPIIAMLLALVFRGVAFEFRWVAKPHHRKWDVAFAAGSTVASSSSPRSRAARSRSGRGWRRPRRRAGGISASRAPCGTSRPSPPRRSVASAGGTRRDGSYAPEFTYSAPDPQGRSAGGAEA